MYIWTGLSRQASYQCTLCWRYCTDINAFSSTCGTIVRCLPLRSKWPGTRLKHQADFDLPHVRSHKCTAPQASSLRPPSFILGSLFMPSSGGDAPNVAPSRPPLAPHRLPFHSALASGLRRPAAAAVRRAIGRGRAGSTRAFVSHAAQHGCQIVRHVVCHHARRNQDALLHKVLQHTPGRFPSEEHIEASFIAQLSCSEKHSDTRQAHIHPQSRQ